jgi:hypothetical protein
MKFVNQPYPYIRGTPPASPESQLKYYQEELKKLERVVATMYEALKELEAKVP